MSLRNHRFRYDSRFCRRIVEGCRPIRAKSMSGKARNFSDTPSVFQAEMDEEVFMIPLLRIRKSAAFGEIIIMIFTFR